MIILVIFTKVFLVLNNHQFRYAHSYLLEIRIFSARKSPFIPKRAVYVRQVLRLNTTQGNFRKPYICQASNHFYSVLSTERLFMCSAQDSPVMNFLNILGQLILLSILWVLCCLPIVTIGAASTALYYTTVKVLRRDAGSLFSSFFTSFRSNFSQSLSVNMVFLTYFAVLAYLLIPELLAGDECFSSRFYVLCSLGFLGMLPAAICYPVISRFYHKGFALLRFLLLLTGRHLLAVVSCALLVLISAFFVLSNSAVLLFLPGIVAYLQSLMLEPIFKKYSDSLEDSQYALWYDP